MEKNKKDKMNRARLASAIALVLILIGGGIAYWQNNQNNEQPPQPTSSDTKEDIDLSPPSQEELKSTQEHKKDLGDQTDETKQNPSSSIKPLITSYGVYSGSVEVGSRVPDVFETDGICTLKLSKSGKVVSKSRKAKQNVSEMSCGFISIPTTQLSSGVWSATISYNSPAVSGTSDAVKVRVP